MSDRLLLFLQECMPSLARQLTLERLELIRLAADRARRLAWLLREIDDRCDVLDGSDGPQPNAEMSLLTAYDQKFGEGAARTDAAVNEQKEGRAER